MTTREKAKEDLAHALAGKVPAVEVYGPRKERRDSPSTEETSVTESRKPRKEHLDDASSEKRLDVDSRLAWGGVSLERGTSATYNLKTITVPPGKPATVGSFPDFRYHGGPVIMSPQVYASFWGTLWLSNQEYKRQAQRLIQFHQDLLKSDYMNVLSQYGVGTGAGSGVFVQSSFVTNIPNSLNEMLVQEIIQSCIGANALPEPPDPSNNILIIYLDETIDMKALGNDLELRTSKKDSAFGYHSFFRTTAGNLFYYAIIPALSDTCLREVYQVDDSNCSLHLPEQQEQRQTQVASHVFAEMTTDPELSAWFDPTYGENGDICNGEPDSISVGANQWTVQRIYSKFDDMQTQGASYSWSQAPAPKPLLSPGPVVGLATKERLLSYAHLLPFPSVHIDIGNEEAITNTQELRKYVLDVFYPLCTAHIIADLPGLLHGVVTMLETEGELLLLEAPHDDSGSSFAQQELPSTLPEKQPLDLPSMLREVAALLEAKASPSDTSQDDISDIEGEDDSEVKYEDDSEAKYEDDSEAEYEDDSEAEYEDDVEKQDDKGEPYDGDDPAVVLQQQQQGTPLITPLQHSTVMPEIKPISAAIAATANSSFAAMRQSGMLYWSKLWPVAISGMLLIILVLVTMLLVATQSMHYSAPTQGHPSSLAVPTVGTTPVGEVISQQQLYKIGWIKAGLSQSDAVAAQHAATTFVQREMSYDYRDMGTRTHHAGTLTAVMPFLTSGARIRFLQNDVRMINNALYDKVSREQIIRQAINVQAKLSQFQAVSALGQPHLFAWFLVSFNRFQSNINHDSGKRIEGIEIDPTLEQPRIYQMTVVLMHVPANNQGPEAQSSWRVNAYDLATTAPLAVETTPTL